MRGLLVVGCLCLALGAGCGESVLPVKKNEYKSAGNIEIYRSQLQARLLQQHKNHPLIGEKVEKVDVRISRVTNAMNGVDKEVEFTQVVYDRWGHRMPELEQQYYIVHFGLGRPQVRAERPQIVIGMNAGGAYSEHEPVRNGMMRQAESMANAAGSRFDPVTGKPLAQGLRAGEEPAEMSTMNVSALPGE